MRLEFATNQMINIFDNNLKFIILKKHYMKLEIN